MADSIFLDNQSTTPTDPRVRDAMLRLRFCHYWRAVERVRVYIGCWSMRSGSSPMNFERELCDQRFPLGSDLAS
jgi:hypothetical protein